MLFHTKVCSQVKVTLEEPAISSLKNVTLLLNSLEDLCFLCNRVANKDCWSNVEAGDAIRFLKFLHTGQHKFS
nr:hypothetical protein CFP56_25487 [Quercus suber]